LPLPPGGRGRRLHVLTPTPRARETFGHGVNLPGPGLLAFGLDAGLIDADRFTDAELTAIAELAVEVGDRAFQLAFERDPRGDDFVVEQAIELVGGYLARIASPR
jgi:DNA-binding SARP family transcriptional activator